MRLALPVLALLGLAGCAATNGGGSAISNFDPKQIAKGDVDRMADAHRREVFLSVRTLADKLYKRNPREWRKGPHASHDAALEALLDPRTGWRLAELPGKAGPELILAGLTPDYAGDRVAAFVAGIGGMLNAAFDNKTEFYMLDDLDPQKLYNAARNLEIAAWKLAFAKDAAGAPLLLSNEMGGGQNAIANLSFEREFGKMIGNLDLLARIIADKENRTIARVAQSLGTFFLPIPGIK